MKSPDALSSSMTYTPQTQWVGNTAPTQQATAKPPAPTTTLKQLRINVIATLAASPWQTASQVTAALGLCATSKPCPEQTLRRMSHRGLIARKWCKSGHWVYGPVGAVQ